MNNLIKAIQFLRPQTIEEVKSDINGKIKIVKIFGKPRMHVQRFLYSGGIVNQIWRKAIKTINNQQLTINNVLILGLGGGTAARIINKNFPEAKIIGVEIDPEIIRLGKKYFELDKIPNLKIVCQDAVEYVGKVKSKKSKVKSAIKNSKFKEKLRCFDLVIVDLYLGEKVPREAETEIFWVNLKKLISLDGLVIFNRLFYRKHRKKAEKFIKKLEKIFSKISLVRTPSNLLVFAQD